VRPRKGAELTLRDAVQRRRGEEVIRGIKTVPRKDGVRRRDK